MTDSNSSNVAADSGLASVVRRPVLMALILWIITFAVFKPALRLDFVDFDDQVYVLENDHVLRGLTWDNLVWAFTNLEAAFWQPLTWLSHMMDVQFFGLNPTGHHLTNVLLHATSTSVLFLLLLRLMGLRRDRVASSIPAGAYYWQSVLVAALFALHPLHVEAVAWVAERKEVLSALFGLLALYFYVGFVQKAENGKQKTEMSGPRPSAILSVPVSRDYWLAFVFFVCALMSKTMVVTLPVVMLLLDFWPLGRVSGSELQVSNWWRLAREKIPFFAASLATGLLTIHAEHAAGALQSTSGVPLSMRIPSALTSCVKYLEQTFWPTKMAVYYPVPMAVAQWAAIFSGLFLIAVTVAAIRLWRRAPYFTMGWLWFVIMLAPVSGIIQIGLHARADRYTYLPLIGIFVALVWGAVEWFERCHWPKIWLAEAMILVLILCAWQTRQQIGHWRDTLSLFAHAVAVTEDNPIAYRNLGDALLAENRLEEAEHYLQLALDYLPYDAEALNNLGLLQTKTGDLDKAIEYYLKALHENSNSANAHCNLANALAMQKKFPEAIEQFKAAIRGKPRFFQAYYNLGLALEESGKPVEALEHFREALRVNPRFRLAAEKIRELTAPSAR